MQIANSIRNFSQIFTTTITNKGARLSGSGTVYDLSALLITIHILWARKTPTTPNQKKNKTKQKLNLNNNNNK